MTSRSKTAHGLRVRPRLTEGRVRPLIAWRSDRPWPSQDEPRRMSEFAQGEEGLLRNPSPKALWEILKTVASLVNERARVRRVDPLPHRPVLEHPFGLMEDNGNRDENGHVFAPRTSWVGAAWCTFGGVKYVRVWGLRGHVHSQAHSYLSLPEASDHESRRCCWGMVFPNRFRRYAERRLVRLARILERIGPPGEDDRVNLNLRWAVVRAHVPGLGVILADDGARIQQVQVVVRDPSTGFRHHISVPPRFGNPRSKTYQELGNARARIHAALAWTFGMKPEEYAPALEA